MKRSILIALMMLPSLAFAQQDIYYRRSSIGGDLALYKIEVGGTVETIVMTHDQLRDAIIAAIPITRTDTQNSGHVSGFHLDSVLRKIYYTTMYEWENEQDGIGDSWLIMRSDLDGSNIEIIFDTFPDGNSVNGLQVMQHSLSVPAVSTWGLGVMVLLLGIAATVVIRRRAAGLAV